MAKKPPPGDREPKGEGPRRRGREHQDHDEINAPDYDGHDGRGEEFDDPEEHLEIERRRFRGGLPPTPELYARAREQWYRLPGALVRPSMDPAVGDSAAGEQPPASQVDPKEDRGRS